VIGKKSPQRDLTDEENLAMLQILNAAFGGEVVNSE